MSTEQCITRRGASGWPRVAPWTPSRARGTTWDVAHAREIRESLPALDEDAKRLLAQVGLDRAR